MRPFGGTATGAGTDPVTRGRRPEAGPRPLVTRRSVLPDLGELSVRPAAVRREAQGDPAGRRGGEVHRHVVTGVRVGRVGIEEVAGRADDGEVRSGGVGGA